MQAQKDDGIGDGIACLVLPGGVKVGVILVMFWWEKQNLDG